MRLAVAHIGVASGLFRSLSQSQGPLSVAQLAERSNASPQLFGRIFIPSDAGSLLTECVKWRENRPLSCVESIDRTSRARLLPSQQNNAYSGVSRCRCGGQPLVGSVHYAYPDITWRLQIRLQRPCNTGLSRVHDGNRLCRGD